MRQSYINHAFQPLLCPRNSKGALWSVGCDTVSDRCKTQNWVQHVEMLWSMSTGSFSSRNEDLKRSNGNTVAIGPEINIKMKNCNGQGNIEAGS
jgi:hypothetical protein